MLKIFKKSRGVLGMNARNLEYIRPENSSQAVKLANNKLASKKVLRRAGIPVPKTYKVIKNRQELEQVDWGAIPKSFVIKPNCGMGGSGIVVIYGKKDNDLWISAAGRLMSKQDIKNHILNIFDGFYSLYGGEDIVFLEERVKISKSLKPYSYRGIPDIRVIVYNNVPVMAMLRLSTKASDGKANLHMGGVGVGIDIATGVTTHAVMYDRVVEKTPDTKMKLTGVKVPYWMDILAIAVKCQKASGLGYVGVDVAIDRDNGPMVLEINAHPGLSIQIANMSPLKYRLQKVKGIKIKSENHAIRVAQDLFGGEIEQEIAEISGKKILGIIEEIKIKYTTNQTAAAVNTDTVQHIHTFEKKKQIVIKDQFMVLKAKVDTGADLSSLDKEVAKALGHSDIIQRFDEYVQQIPDLSSLSRTEFDQLVKENVVGFCDNLYGTVVISSSHGVSYRLVIKMKVIMADTEMNMSFSIIDRSKLAFPVIIGRKNLTKFLVDPVKFREKL